MGLNKSARVSEPVLERWDDGLPDEHENLSGGMEIFRLSGGVLGPSSKTSNRIDGLLVRMLDNESAKYLGDIDKNLDYLYTSLQLDLIERMASDVSSRHVPEPVPREIPEPTISLDRARSSV